MSEVLIRGGLVLAHAKHQPERLDIYVENGRIKALLAPGTPVNETIPEFDATQCLIHPGLINAHTHGHGALTKGVADRWNLEQLIAMGASLNQNRSHEFMQLSAQLNAAEMLLKGCTAAFDLYGELPTPSPEGLEAVADAYSQSGLRVALAPMFADQNFYRSIPDLLRHLPLSRQQLYLQGADKNMEAILESLRAVFNTKYDRVSWALAPSIPLVSSDDFLMSCHELAMELGIKIHTHALESPLQKQMYPKRYQGGLIQHLSRLGILNEQWVLAHCVWLNATELALLAEHQVAIAHNPVANLRLGSGIADVRKMLDYGLKVGIGTDGASSSDNQNMYESVRMGALLSRIKTPQVTEWLSAQEVFFAATEGGAACLGLEGQVGRLQEGYLADMVFVDLSHINWQPLNHVLQQLVYVEDAQAVRHVMVDGEWMVRDGVLLRLSLADLMERATLAREQLQILEGLQTDQNQELLAAIGQFCACSH